MQHIRTTELPAVFATRDLPPGTSRKILQRKNLERVTNGVYRRTDQEPTYKDTAIAIHRSLPGSIIAGLTAAQFYTMRVDAAEQFYFISQQRIRRETVVCSRAEISAQEIRQSPRFLITSAERTFLDLGAHLSVQDLVVVADGLVNHHPHRTKNPPEHTPESLGQYLDTAPQAKGKSKCRQALRLAAVGADSSQETKLRLLLQEHGVEGLVPNPALRNEWGWVMIEPDLADYEYGLSIQYEGAHHGSARQLRKDEDRLRKTRSLGWEEVKIFASDLTEYAYWDGAYLPRAVVKVKEARALRRPQG